MANAIVIYYSLWGHAEKAANVIAEKLGAKAYRIEEQKKKKGLTGMLQGIMEVIAGTVPPIKPMNLNMSYDTIFLGCPVWLASPAPAVVACIRQTDLKDKKVILFLTHAFSNTKRCVHDLVTLIRERGGTVSRAFAIKTLGVKEETVVHEAAKIAEVIL